MKHSSPRLLNLIIIYMFNSNKGISLPYWNLLKTSIRQKYYRIGYNVTVNSEDHTLPLYLIPILNHNKITQHKYFSIINDLFYECLNLLIFSLYTETVLRFVLDWICNLNIRKMLDLWEIVCQYKNCCQLISLNFD